MPDGILCNEMGCIVSECSYFLEKGGGACPSQRKQNLIGYVSILCRLIKIHTTTLLL
jgi:hypothetical protein